MAHGATRAQVEGGKCMLEKPVGKKVHVGKTSWKKVHVGKKCMLEKAVFEPVCNFFQLALLSPTCTFSNLHFSNLHFLKPTFLLIIGQNSG